MLELVIFFAGLVLIYYSSQLLIEYSTQFGHLMHWPEMVVGFLIIGIGTSAPEIAVSYYSLFTGHDSMVIGNLVGSNMTNSMLVWGLALIMISSGFKRPTKSSMLWLAILTILFCFGLLSHHFSRWLGIAMLALGVASIFMMLGNKVEPSPDSKPTHGKTWLLTGILLSLVGVVYSAKLIIDNGQIIAGYMGLNEGIFALVFVALGTSLPEIVLTMVAIKRGYSDLIIGNIVGSNICNIAFGLGICAILKPFAEQDQLGGYYTIGLVLSTIAFLLVAIIKSWRSRIMGVLLIAGYIGLYTYLMMAKP